jgi:trk system potassium uptake protein TrkA
MRIVIVGGGKVVYFLSRSFISKGYAVTIINRDKEECTRLARALKATVVHGEGSDPRILEEVGTDTIGGVLAVTPNDEDNLVICQLAALRFHIPRILALVNDPDNEQVFQELGIAAISTTRILSTLIEEKASLDSITNLFTVGEGKIIVTELILEKTSPVIGKELRDIQLPENSLIVSLMRGNQAIVPRGHTLPQEDDRIVVITLPENHGQVMKILTSEKG